MIFVLPLIIAVSLLIFYHLRSKNRQREILIEKGINPDGMSILGYQKLANLTNSILFISIALGLLLGYGIKAAFNPDDFLIVYFIAISFFCGIGFLINYFIFRNAKIK